MNKLLLTLLLGACSFTLADNIPQQCTPKITQQTLTYQKSDNTPVYFAGFIIELPPPKTIGLFGDNTVFKYGSNKAIYLTYSTQMLTEGRTADDDPVTVYKEAFGLLPKQDKNKAEIKMINNLERLCDNELISYKINKIDYDVIRIKYQNKFADNTIDTFILGQSKEVYTISFKGFTNTEIDQLLATIHKPVKK